MKLTKNSRIIGGVLAATIVIGACGDAVLDDDAGSDATTTTPADAGSATTANSGSDIAASDIAASNHLGDYVLIDEDFGTMTTVTVEDGTRTIVTNALPDHETGEFPNAGNPNTISAQDITYEYPAEGTYVGTATPVRTTGVALNGVKFEPATGETVTCASGETFRIEALQDLYDLGLDFNNAHVQPDGEYHYHGISELLVDAYSADEDLVHIGFASDGNLIWFSKSGAYESSYTLTDEARTGTDCTASGPAGGDPVDIDGSTPDGTYTSDFVFTDGAGDLDECNGTEIDGEYGYVVTFEYPYVGRCVMGEATEEIGGGAAPDGAGGAPATPDFTDAAAALGITVEELEAALGGPPPDLNQAAETLGITLEELEAVLPPPPGQ